MSSLADAPELVGFFSYSREDDEDSGGKLSKLRDCIQAELRGQLGRTKRDFRLWQDKTAIAHGELWEDTIKKGISESVFFIPIITPTAVRSSYCKFEFESFLAREKELGRSNLVFPILYIPVAALADDRWRQDSLLSIIGSRQYEEWQGLRHLDPSSTEVGQRVEKFCANICRALEQEWLSPEERREAEAQRVVEAERRRQQEAEIKQHADEEERRRKSETEQKRLRDEEERWRQEIAEEARRRQEAQDRRRLAAAEAERRQRDEERRRLEAESRRAAKEEQHRTQSEQEPQEPVKPWLLPLIGAGAASLPGLLVEAWMLAKYGWPPASWYFYLFAAVMIYALYGGAAGMLIRRFGIPKAVAIPVIPALLLFLVVAIVHPPLPETIVSVVLELGGSGRRWIDGLVLAVMAVMCTWLAFWWHSRWVRKQ